jgi:hypothetical protein
MTNTVDIWNMALSTVGSTNTVSTELENTPQANLCRLWYAQARRVVLKAASWPSATRTVALAVVSERDFSQAFATGDPQPPWRFAYSEPSDLLAPRYLSTFRQFARGFIGSQSCLFTNDEDALLTYTFDQTEAGRWDAGLRDAVISYLAARIAPGITGKANARRELLSDAYSIIQTHQTDLANEQDVQFISLPEAIAARGYSGSPQQTRFFYPYEDISGEITRAV